MIFIRFVNDHKRLLQNTVQKCHVEKKNCFGLICKVKPLGLDIFKVFFGYREGQGSLDDERIQWRGEVGAAPLSPLKLVVKNNNSFTFAIYWLTSKIGTPVAGTRHQQTRITDEFVAFTVWYTTEVLSQKKIIIILLYSLLTSNV